MSQEGKNKQIILFGDFIEFLRTHGYPIGVDTHLKINRILERVEEGFPAESLKTLLSPIFANSSQQQEDFYQLFDSFFERYQSHSAFISPPPDPPSEDENVVRRPGMLGILARRRYYLTLQIILVLALGFIGVQGIDCYIKTGRIQGAAYCVLGLNDPFIIPKDTLVVTETPGILEEDESDPNLINSDEDPEETSDQSLSEWLPLENGKPIGEDISDLKAGIFQQYGPLVKFLMIIFIITAFLFYEFYWRNKRKFFLLKERSKSPPFIWTINRDPKDFKLYSEQQFFEASRKLREREPVQSQELDLDKTIDETLETGGYPSLQFKSKSRPPEYLVLIEKQSTRDHQAMLFDQLILELEQQDLFIERYFYEEDPRLCWKKRYVEEVYLEDLFRKYPEDRVIVIGSVDHFFDPVDDHLCSWTHIFKKWKKVAIVTPKCPLDWGHREIALSQTHVLLPSTTLALSMLVDIFNQDQKISLRYWLEQNRYPIPPQEESEDLLAELEVYFDTSFDGFDRKYEKGSGKEIFTWLCMCSIYPEIFWDLTLTLGDALAKQRGMTLVTPENLFKLVSLPWYRAGDMPDHIREKLMVRLNREDMILARKALVEVLKDNPPPKDSYAEAEHQLQIALQEAAISPTISKNIKLIQEAQNYSINHEIKDFTVIKSLNSIPKSMLKVSLPQKVASAIFRQGIPALGAKTWVRGAIGTALVLMIIFTLDPSRLDRVHSFSGEKYFLENKSSRMRYHTYLGNVYLDSLNYDAARENYLKALSLRDEVREESYLVPEFNLTYLTWETGNQDEAKNEFARIGDKVEEIIADSSLNDNKKKVLATIRNEAKYNQGVINYRSQEIDEAEEQFRDVVKKDSSNTRAIYAEAVLFLQKALKTQGANRQNSFNLAMNRVKDIQSVSPDYFANHPELSLVLDSLNQSTQNPDIRSKISDLMLTISGQEVVEVKEIPLTIDNNQTEEPANIPSDLKYLTDFTEGLALVENKGKFGFIDEKANLKGVRFEDASPFSEGLAAVQSQGKWGFINKQLETVIPFEYERAKDFSNGWASVKIKGKWGMIDKENKMTIPPVYDAPVEFEKTSSGDASPLAAVFRNGKYEYINQEGELVFGDKKFQYAGNFNENNRANVKRWGKKYQIDRNGNCIESSVEDGKCPTEQWEYQQIATLKQHSEPINVALYAPDGTFLLTASSDGKAIIYDQRGSQVLTTLEHGSKINAAAISPNSNLIATGGEDQSVKVWRKASQNSWIQVHSFNDARATIWSLAFSPDSRLLAAGAGDQLIRVYDINTGASRRFSGHTIGAVTTLAFSPNGETLVSGGEDETVRFWNVSSGRQTTPISQPFGHVTSLAFSPDGKLLAIGTQNRLVKVYQTGSSPLKLIKQFDQFRDWVSSVSFSGDGQYLLASSYDNRLWIWNFTNRNPVLWLRHPGTVKSAAISPDGQYVLTASWGERGKNQARVFKIETYGK